MTRNFRLLCAPAAVLLLASCQKNEATPADAVRDITALLNDLMAADDAGDVDRVMAFYTDDALLLPPDGPNKEGAAAIRKHYEGAFAAYKLEISAQADEIHAGPEWGVVRGTVTGKIAEKKDGVPRALHDKFMGIVRRSGTGPWRFSRLIWSPVKKE
jgi:uncharacterized protein (TIGR02246 family)